MADRYQLLAAIGEGGMGTVWRARDLRRDVDVAVKLLRREVAEPTLVLRFMREARESARLQHPSIVRTLDFATTSGGEPFMVMELLRGRTLANRLDAETRIPPREAVALLLPIVSALAVAHRAGVVHRDVKPENVFLVESSDGSVRPVLMDFGLAKVGQTASGRCLTERYALVGTPEYMSPEQFSGEEDIDGRSDVWSLCVMLYEVLAGWRPFPSDEPLALFAAVIARRPPMLDELCAADARLSAIVERGLAKSPEDRWSSMHELGAALAQWSRPTPSCARASASPRRGFAW
ncbi:MAG: serine/threonine-protein kinase [Polyangiaceae bacterium]